MSTLRETWILPINSTIWRRRSIKLFPEIGHDEYIILCNFGGRSISGFKVIEEDSTPSGAGNMQNNLGVRNLLEEICHLNM